LLYPILAPQAQSPLYKLHRIAGLNLKNSDVAAEKYTIIEPGQTLEYDGFTLTGISADHW